jgi:hypothetical protein
MDLHYNIMPGHEQNRSFEHIKVYTDINHCPDVILSLRYGQPGPIQFKFKAVAGRKSIFIPETPIYARL